MAELVLPRRDVGTDSSTLPWFSYRDGDRRSHSSHSLRCIYLACSAWPHGLRLVVGAFVPAANFVYRDGDRRSHCFPQFALYLPGLFSLASWASASCGSGRLGREFRLSRRGPSLPQFPTVCFVSTWLVQPGLMGFG